MYIFFHDFFTHIFSSKQFSGIQDRQVQDEWGFGDMDSSKERTYPQKWWTVGIFWQHIPGAWLWYDIYAKTHPIRSQSGALPHMFMFFYLLYKVI